MTIFAQSTVPGRSAITVIRISGALAGNVVKGLAGSIPPSRRASLRPLHHPKTGEILDQAVVLWFSGPASYTGEDVAEFHLHGGRAVVDGVLDVLAVWPGLRVAEPGEFTRRAFENGKMDLTEAEGLADLVAAETRSQKRQALRQLDGEIGRLYEGWRETLMSGLALVEAEIDFPEEGLPDKLTAPVWDNIRCVVHEIRQHLDDQGRGERLRQGLSAVIVGAPNVGKSSLLNHLAQRDAAIVSDQAGTTRDIVEVELDLGGYPLVVADTAGLRRTDGGVEKEGVRRARARASEADLILAMFDARSWPEADPATRDILPHDGLMLVNKTDLLPGSLGRGPNGRRVWPISCRTGAGLDDLLGALTAVARDRLDPGAAPALTRARHRGALETCVEALEQAMEEASAGRTPELAGEDLRHAVAALGRITGRVDVEDLLDVVFRELCIGK